MCRLSLQVHELLQVRIEEEDSSPVSLSRVEGLSEGDLLVSWPTYRGVRIPLSEDQILYVSFSQGETLQEFRAVVLKKQSLQAGSVVLRPLAPPQPVQRRENVRAEVFVDVELAARVIPLSSFKESRQSEYHIQARTTSLSGGGFTVRHDYPIPVGTLFDVSMKLKPGSPMLVMSARIVRCALTCSAENETVFELALEFTKIPESSRARIVRHVFRMQREGLLKNGPKDSLNREDL